MACRTSRPPCFDMFDARQGHAYSPIVRTPVLVERDVEIHSHENTLLGNGKIMDRLFVHYIGSLDVPAVIGEASLARSTTSSAQSVFMDQSPPCILIVGPTAGGKTSLSLELAQCLPGGGECICADSMQVYRGMDIGTAKPTPDERAKATHHLLDLVEPDEPFTVDHWLPMAEEKVRDIRARGRFPILVGGTNLYIKAFMSG